MHQNTPTALGEIDGDRVEVAVGPTCVRDGSCYGESGEDGVEKDAVGGDGGGERLQTLAENIV